MGRGTSEGAGTGGDGVPVGDESQEAVASVGEVTGGGGVHAGESTAPKCRQGPKELGPQ